MEDWVGRMFNVLHVMQMPVWSSKTTLTKHRNNQHYTNIESIIWVNTPRCKKYIQHLDGDSVLVYNYVRNSEPDCALLVTQPTWWYWLKSLFRICQYLTVLDMIQTVAKICKESVKHSPLNFGRPRVRERQNDLPRYALYNALGLAVKAWNGNKTRETSNFTRLGYWLFCFLHFPQVSKNLQILTGLGISGIQVFKNGNKMYS